MMWWGCENFTKPHLEGERLSFPWDKNREEQLKRHSVHWQEEEHSCRARGTGDRSHFTCGDLGLGSKTHNPKFCILNHWQTPWKTWNSLGVKTPAWLSQPYPTTELSCVTKTSQCHCRDCRSTFWFCSSWEFGCQHLLVSAKEIQASLLIKTLKTWAQFESQLHILSGQYMPAKGSEESRGEWTTDY